MKKLIANSLIITLLFTLLISCGGVKIAGGGSKANKLYEVFYIKNGVTQYFVKPLKYKSKDIKFTMDYTLRSDVKKDGFIVCNFSTFSEKPIKKIETFKLNIDGKKYEFKELEKVFLEKQKNDYHLRYTSKLSFEDYSKLTESVNSTVELNNIVFETSKKNTKKLGRIDEYVVDLIELNFED